MKKKMPKSCNALLALLIVLMGLLCGYENDITTEASGGGEVYDYKQNNTNNHSYEPILPKDIYTMEFKDRARLTFAEGGILSLKEQICLTAVPYNREESSLFPKSNNFYEVAYDPGEFASVRDGKIYNEGKVVDFAIVPERTIEAVKRAQNGEDPTEQMLWDQAVKQGLDPEYYASGGALFFIGADYFYEVGWDEDITVFVHPEGFHHVFFKIWG